MIAKLLKNVLLVALLLTMFQSSLQAAQPTYTSVVVDNMHCDTCAKKIAAKLYLLPGVLEIRADVKSNTAYVIPQQTKGISPKAIWEAVESAGFKPLKLVSPGGTFVRKPAV